MLAALAQIVLSALLSFSSVAMKEVGPYQLGWWLKASGSAQVVADGNHYWAEGYDQFGNYQGRLFDQWLDGYCTIGGITSGDNQGTPIRIQLVAPFGWDSGCIGVGDGSYSYWNQYYGWTNGLGGYSGQNFYDRNRVALYESYVFPRSGSNSRGTTLELW